MTNNANHRWIKYKNDVSCMEADSNKKKLFNVDINRLFFLKLRIEFNVIVTSCWHNRLLLRMVYGSTLRVPCLICYYYFFITRTHFFCCFFHENNKNEDLMKSFHFIMFVYLVSLSPYMSTLYAVDDSW